MFSACFVHVHTSAWLQFETVSRRGFVMEHRSNWPSGKAVDVSFLIKSSVIPSYAYICIGHNTLLPHNQSYVNAVAIATTKHFVAFSMTAD